MRGGIKKIAILSILGFAFSLPNAVFAYVDNYSGETTKDYASQCVAGTFNCSCATASTSTNSSAESVTSSAGACDSFCKDTIKADTFNYTCTLSSGTANYTIKQGNVGDTSVTTSTVSETEVPDFVVPILNISIPGFSGFTTPTASADKSTVSVNFLGEYINALYKWIIPAGALVAVVFMMIGGLQYVLARGKPKYIDKAKTRITNAITGVILLFAAYNIAYLIDPRLLTLDSLTLDTVDAIKLQADTKHKDEGTGTAVGATWKTLPEPYLSIVTAAKNDTALACPITNGFLSFSGKNPNTGTPPKSGMHHWYDNGANGDYKKIRSMDYAMPWDTVIPAPFDGTVTYIPATRDNGCGNMILFQSSESTQTKITLCHNKDFLVGTESTPPTTRTVKRGDPIGHVGGITCASDSDKNRCPSATVRSTSCKCQTKIQSGNTTGAHVHIQWNSSPGTILSCLQ